MDKHLQQLEAYKVTPLEELFEVEEVKVEVRFNDMPGAMFQLAYSGDVPIAGILACASIIKQPYLTCFCQDCWPVKSLTTVILPGWPRAASL